MVVGSFNQSGQEWVYIHDKFERRVVIIARITGLSRCSFPLNYLGVPIFYGRAKTLFFEYLVDKVRNELDRWKARILSFGGRITLIKTVLQSYPIYTIASNIHRIERLMAQFLWNVRGEARTHWINWEGICLHTSEGGLGLRRVPEMIEALHAKLMWTSMVGDSLWQDM